MTPSRILPLLPKIVSVCAASHRAPTPLHERGCAALQKGMFFRYSATPPHPTAKPSWGWLRIGVRKPRLVFGGIRATWNQVTATPRSYWRGCLLGDLKTAEASSMFRKLMIMRISGVLLLFPTSRTQHIVVSFTTTETDRLLIKPPDVTSHIPPQQVAGGWLSFSGNAQPRSRQ